jgi:hypothetical protein
MAAIHNMLISASSKNFVSIVVGIPKIEFTGSTNADGIQSSKYPVEDEFNLTSQTTTMS